MESQADAAPVEFGGITPILNVASLPVSLAFYIGQLGFELAWQAGSDFAQVGRGKVALMLCVGGQGRPGTWAYAGISDADAYYRELMSRGVAVRHPPTNYPWGARELQVQDPDGHVLRFGSDATDEPCGTWCDTDGRLWMPQADGSWQEVAAGAG